MTSAAEYAPRKDGTEEEQRHPFVVRVCGEQFRLTSEEMSELWIDMFGAINDERAKQK